MLINSKLFAIFFAQKAQIATNRLDTVETASYSRRTVRDMISRRSLRGKSVAATVSLLQDIARPVGLLPVIFAVVVVAVARTAVAVVVVAKSEIVAG